MSSSSTVNILRQAARQQQQLAESQQAAAGGLGSAPPPEAIAHLPPHILLSVPREKLIKQTPIYSCPNWAGAPAYKDAHLVVTRDGVKAQADIGIGRFPFYIFGQGSECDVRLENPSISRYHCILVHNPHDRSMILIDASTNGTKVNGVRIEKRKEHMLRFGDVIQFGESVRLYKVVKDRPAAAAKKPHASEKISVSAAEARPPVPDVLLPDGTVVKGSSAAGVVPSNIVPAATEEGEAVVTSSSDVPAVVDVVVPNVASTTTVEESTTAPAPPAPVEPVAPPAPLPAEQVLQRHFRQIVIKHKELADGGLVVSKNPTHNSALPITRSLDDATALANQLRELEGIQSEEKFIEVCKEFSEVKAAKKGGDLGMVEKGEFGGTFDVAAFSLGPACISMPFATELGIHLVYRVPEKQE